MDWADLQIFNMNFFDTIQKSRLNLLTALFLLIALIAVGEEAEKITSANSLTIDFQYEILTNCEGTDQNLTATAIANGGVPPYHYLWWDGSTDSLSHSGSVSFFVPPFTVVTITDSTGCEVEGVISVVTTPNGLDMITSFSDALCPGDSTGTIEVLIIGGEPPYQLEWSDPNFPPELIQTNLPSGVYELTVTDANDCSITSQVSIDEPSEIDMSITVSPETNGNNNGEINLTVTGGTPNLNGIYHYQWYYNGLLLPDTTEDLSQLAAGEYQVVVTDDNGCTQSSELIIVESLVPTFDLDPGSILTIYPQPAHDYLLLEWRGQKQTEGYADYAIYNLLGQVLIRSSFLQRPDGINRIPVNTLPSGSYYLVVQFDGKHFSQKIIIQ